MTIAELRVLLAKATPGPWEMGGDDAADWDIRQSADPDASRWVCDGVLRREDADFIVASVRALPALLDVAEAARAVMTDTLERHEAESWRLANALRDALARLER